MSLMWHSFLVALLHFPDIHNILELLYTELISSIPSRMNPLDPLKKVLLGQHIYFWILLPIYGVWVVIQTIGEDCVANTS